MTRVPTSRAVLALCLSSLLLLALVPGTSAGKGSRDKQTAVEVPFETFEPTLGATADGDLYFSTTPTSGVAIGWSASVARSEDGGRKWEDVGPHLPTGHTMPPETNDPYIYVDPATGRVFTFHMGPILTCSITSYSDDDGATWHSNPAGCGPTGVWDHQTMVAAKPRTLTTVGYPNVLHQCVNAIYAAMCSRSIDGGLSWQPSVPVHINDQAVHQEEEDNSPYACGAQHGHLAAGPDGTVYLPTSQCGTAPAVFITQDDGLTWERSEIADMDMPFVDPTVSADSKGNLYAAWINEAGWLYYSVSRDGGFTWDKYVKLGNGVTANMPVIVAGDPGKAVIAYPGTDDLDKGYDTEGYGTGSSGDAKFTAAVEWGAYLTVTHNGLTQRPKFDTVLTTGKDPIGRGHICGSGTRCAYLIDFIEAVIGPDGRPYASFVDGCTGKCGKDPKLPNDPGTGLGLLATLQSGPPLCANRCWRYEAENFAGGDLLGALDSDLSAAELSVARAHSVEAFTPRMKAMWRDASASRRAAVFGIDRMQAPWLGP